MIMPTYSHMIMFSKNLVVLLDAVNSIMIIAEIEKKLNPSVNAFVIVLIYVSSGSNISGDTFKALLILKSSSAVIFRLPFTILERA